MSDAERDLPDLHTALLCESKLDDLFSDITVCAEVQSVRVKAGARVGSDEAPISLEEARNLLVTGKTSGVQIRYFYKDAEYLDTVLRVEGGYRIIRR